ncbi:MAG: SIMPL domain-containing protein [Ghiorsea sp.]
MHIKLTKKSIFSLFLFSLLSFTTASFAQESGIEVSGISKVSIVPDIARFSFAIDGRGKELAPLKEGVDQKTFSLIHLCKQLGIKTKDIKSSEVSIHPQYNYQSNTLKGYQVAREVKVLLNNLKQYSKLVNGAIQSGITSIKKITLDTSKRKTLQQEALSNAVHDAYAKAQILASSSGLILGKALSIREGGVPIQRTSFRAVESMRMDGATQSPFEPGEITVSATVSIKYSAN